jgi:threonylcarbamoyladenosine tRNA methylthiotransferase MtaB
MPQVSCLLSNTEKKDLDAKVLAFAGPGKERQISPFRSRASVKIQDGCNFQCTFCIIPSVRGRSVSLDKRELLARIKEFINLGFKEIVLTGIHLCSYGLDLSAKSSLLELLQEIESLNGLRKLRLSSLDPRFLSSSLIEHITASEKVCPHFHLSLQSGSDDIVHRMGRKIRIEDYKNILTYLREESPRASLGADIIVGFPGETEEDFSQTYRFLEQSTLTYLQVFSYSPRPGTVAASWRQINGKVKKERARLLRDLSSRKNTNFRRFLWGRNARQLL